MFTTQISNKKEHAKGIITFTVKNTWMAQYTFSKHGWGNGYIGLPKEHPLFGREYEDLNDVATVHGGFTFGEIGEIDGKEYHVFGFDTCHDMNDMQRWPESLVIEEIESIVTAFINFSE